jgi:hypothetical protein
MTEAPQPFPDIVRPLERRVIAFGEKSGSLRSSTMTEAFGAELMLRCYHGGYRLYHLKEGGSEVV